jgi:transposase
MGGVVSAVAGFVSGERAGARAKKEAKRTRASQEKIAGEELAESRRRTEVVRERTEPFVKLGTEAQERLGELTRGPLEESESFKFRQKLETEALDKDLARRGLTGSGAAVQAHQDLNARLVAEEQQFQIGQLQQTAQLGAGLTSATTQGVSSGPFQRLSSAVQREGAVRGQVGSLQEQARQRALETVGGSVFQRLGQTKVGGAIKRFGNRLFPTVNTPAGGGGGGGGFVDAGITPFIGLA